jgi:hypothetical protein
MDRPMTRGIVILKAFESSATSHAGSALYMDKGVAVVRASLFRFYGSGQSVMFADIPAAE